MKWIIILIFLFSCVLSSAIEANLDCPKSVVVNEEFPCYLTIKDIEGLYDLKVEIEDEGKTIAKIFNPFEEKWQSAYYYLKEFVKDSEKTEILLMVEKEGDFDLILKLRKGSKREFFDYKINVIGSKMKKEAFEEIEQKSVVFEDGVTEPKTNGEKQTILLNEPEKNPQNEIVYKSKNKKVLDYLPHLFSILLIFIIVVLLWEKF